VLFRSTAVISYGAAADASWRITAERSGASGTEVELDTPHGPLRLELAVAGHHNVLNALGALAAVTAAAPDLDPAALAAGLASFTGARSEEHTSELQSRFDLV